MYSGDLGCCQGDGLCGACRCLLVAQSVLPNARAGKASPLPHFTGKSLLATVPQLASLFQQQNDFAKDSWGDTGAFYLTVAFLHDSRSWQGLRYFNIVFYVHNVRKELKRRNKILNGDIRYGLWLQVGLGSASIVYFFWNIIPEWHVACVEAISCLEISDKIPHQMAEIEDWILCLDHH